ncbi:exopolysaccharide biosynthesis protein [Alkalicaulis satelles]|uniref:exopolysaccharide biosynthesis protein n=1 Tax=Alkalicaulis satelles TaxID=2609175 RepID=UPI0018EB990B|nr:exopolysaccharide biosynthesis protein [Alkalicaulis satelles]
MSGADASFETAQPRGGLIAALEVIAREAPEEGLTLTELGARLGERAFGVILFALAIPVCMPFLYGVPQIVALPMMALALQMAAGRAQPWLPARLGARRLSRAALMRTAQGARKWFGWVERLARPRLRVLTGPVGERVTGALFVLFCASILTPLPLTNSTPGIAIAIAAIGLITRDGLVLLAGLILGAAWIAILTIGFALFGLAFVELMSQAIRAAASWGGAHPLALTSATAAGLLALFALWMGLRRRAPSRSGRESDNVDAMAPPPHPALRLIDRVMRPDLWPLIGAGGSAALLAGAFAFEIFGDFPPCPLCIDQRWAHVWVVIAGLGLGAIFRFAPTLPDLAMRAGAGLMAAFFAFAAWQAMRHAGLEYGLLDTQCPAADISGLTLEQLMAQLDTAQTVVACDEVVWSLFGISMAGYNALVSGALCAISLLVMFRKPVRSAS